MDIDVNRLARRAAGPRLLVYLDQSTLSALATEKDHAGLLDLLRTEVNTGRLICPASPSHNDETARVHIRDQGPWKEIDGLADELSIGTGFRGKEEIELAEIHAAAAAFEGHESRPIWKKAFRTDPNTLRDELFFGFGGAQIRVRASSSQTRCFTKRSRTSGTRRPTWTRSMRNSARKGSHSRKRPKAISNR
ncbi:MAG: hypothetical protein ABW196_08155 [Solirubrobacterales bacterium]